MRIYEDMAYGDGPIADSFWLASSGPLPEHAPLTRDATTDVAIIGAGFTGLNAALALAEAGRDVTVLDARQPGWGASGRNGGFCCLGGAKIGHKALVRRHGEAAARAYWQIENDAVAHVTELLDRYGIEADTHSDGETMLATNPRTARALPSLAQEVEATRGLTSEIVQKEDLAAAGLASAEFHGALTIRTGFALNPLRYVLGLANAARSAGALICGDSPVTSVRQDATGHYLLRTPAGQLRARHVIFATNGYGSDTMPTALAGRYLPVQSNILVTRPLADDELQAQGWTSRQMCYDSRTLLHYFRLLPDNRMLFGLRGALSATETATNRIRNRARADFERIFPAWRHVETPYFWSGLACLARNLTPFAGPVPGMERAYAGFAYHGNGVAMGSYSGKLIADQILDRPLPDMTVMQAAPRRFALGRHRRLLLRPAYFAAGLLDRV